MDIVELVAQFLYKQNVAAPQWDKEQESHKLRYTIQAEQLIDELAKSNLQIVPKAEGESQDQPEKTYSRTRAKKNA